MIDCINYKNLKEFGGEFYSSFLLRHESFIDRQAYDVSSYRGMEFDQYDSPAATYLVYSDENGEALGVSRLTPTTMGTMLEDLFPDFVEDPSNLNHKKIWEGTRYCIKKDITPELRRRIIGELALAYLEFGLDQGLDKIIGMMPTFIYKSVFQRQGIKMEDLGRAHHVDGIKVRAVAIPINKGQLENVRKKTGIYNSVLRYKNDVESGEHKNVA